MSCIVFLQDHNKFFARHPEYIPQSKSVDVIPTQISLCNFELIPRPPAEPGGIAGTVFNHFTGEPISEAVILIDGIETFAPILTDENGYYEFFGIRPGLTIVKAYKEGFDPQRKEVPIESGLTTIADFHLIPDIQGPGAIAGKVCNTETGEPVGGASICYHPVENDEDDGTEPEDLSGDNWPSVISDDDGSFRIEPLRPGKYVLLIKHPDFLLKWQRVVVFAVEETEVKVDLIPNIQQEPGTIRGVVQDRLTSEPLSEARVYYYPVLSPDVPTLWPVDDTDSDGVADHSPILEPPFVLTNENGEYTIEGLRPGIWELAAVKEGYYPEDRRTEVQAGETTEESFELAPMVAVEPGNILGMVNDWTTTEPIANAVVCIHRLPDPGIGFDPRSPDNLIACLNVADLTTTTTENCIQTNEEGKFEFFDLDSGHYQISVEAEGYFPQCQIRRVESGETTEIIFNLLQETNETGSLFGRVVNAQTNEPLGDTQVWVTPDGVITIQNVEPAVILGEARTNQNGEYRIGDLPVGPVIVYAAKEEFRQANKEAFIYPLEETECNFALQPFIQPLTGHIAGSVKDSGTTEPVRNALILLIPDRGDDFELSRRLDLLPFTLTDEDGMYAFRDVPVGSYRLLAVKFECLPSLKHTVVHAGEISEVHFRLDCINTPSFGSVAGQVIDEETGEPIAEAWVRLHNDFENPLTNAEERVTRTNERGFYRFQDVMPGEYAVLAAKRGYEPQRKPTLVIPGERSIIDFELSPISDTGSLSGLVSDSLTR